MTSISGIAFERWEWERRALRRSGFDSLGSALEGLGVGGESLRSSGLVELLEHGIVPVSCKPKRFRITEYGSHFLIEGSSILSQEIFTTRRWIQQALNIPLETGFAPVGSQAIGKSGTRFRIWRCAQAYLRGMSLASLSERSGFDFEELAESIRACLSQRHSGIRPCDAGTYSESDRMFGFHERTEHRETETRDSPRIRFRPMGYPGRARAFARRAAAYYQETFLVKYNGVFWRSIPGRDGSEIGPFPLCILPNPAEATTRAGEMS